MTFTSNLIKSFYNHSFVKSYKVHLELAQSCATLYLPFQRDLHDIDYSTYDETKVFDSIYFNLVNLSGSMISSVKTNQDMGIMEFKYEYHSEKTPARNEGLTVISNLLSQKGHDISCSTTICGEERILTSTGLFTPKSPSRPFV